MSNQVDLQTVSIDPLSPSIKKGSQTTIFANIKNNVGVIEKGGAKIHCTINGQYLSKPNTFRSVGIKWKLEAIKTQNGNHELFAVNAEPIPTGQLRFPGIKFSVRGKAIGVADITLVSSLSADSQSSDVDGANQSARTQLIVTK